MTKTKTTGMVSASEQGGKMPVNETELNFKAALARYECKKP